MRVRRIKGVNKVTKRLADGSKKTFYYHRATGARLPDDPETAAFLLAVERLDKQFADGQAAKAKAPEKTIEWLVKAYQKSTDWTGLRESTRAIEQFNVNAIVAEFGDMELEAVEQKGARAEFLEWQDELAQETPRAADAKLARLAKILAWGVEREHIERNPIATFKRVYKGDRSEILWLPEHFKAMHEASPFEVQIALTIGLHTGQRKGDLFSLTWKQYDGEGIGLVQSKGKRRVYIPCTKALKTTLDALKQRHGDRAGLDDHILVDPDGSPWTKPSFRTPWGAAFEASGLKEDLHFHDLRGTAVTMLAEAGCTTPEIASITGHTLKSVDKILETYLARTRLLAENAIAKFELRLVA